MMKSYASPSFHISKQASVYLGIGGNWLRSTKISDRSLKGFSTASKMMKTSINLEFHYGLWPGSDSGSNYLNKLAIKTSVYEKV